MPDSLFNTKPYTTNKITKILIADDHPLVRHALKTIIQRQRDMRVIGEASNGEDAVLLAIKEQPDVLIMDIGMPKVNGLEATKAIKAQCPQISILVLTVYTDNEYVLGFLEAGAAGYLTKDVFGSNVIHAIQAIADGEVILTPKVLGQILKPRILETGNILTHNNFDLTNRELALLKLLAKGLSNKNIAAQASLSELTIKRYLVEIFSKLKVSSRTEAVITGLKSGLINFADLE